MSQEPGARWVWFLGTPASPSLPPPHLSSSGEGGRRERAQVGEAVDCACVFSGDGDGGISSILRVTCDLAERAWTTDAGTRFFPHKIINRWRPGPKHEAVDGDPESCAPFAGPTPGPSLSAGAAVPEAAEGASCPGTAVWVAESGGGLRWWPMGSPCGLRLGGAVRGGPSRPHRAGSAEYHAPPAGKAEGVPA